MTRAHTQARPHSWWGAKLLAIFAFRRKERLPREERNDRLLDAYWLDPRIFPCWTTTKGYRLRYVKVLLRALRAELGKDRADRHV